MIRILRLISILQVPEEVIEELTSATDTPAIVHAEPKKKNFWQRELLFVDALFGIQSYGLKEAENKKKKTFNFFKEDPDFKNYNGWSTVVTKHDLHALHGSHISVFMANLTKVYLEFLIIFVKFLCSLIKDLILLSVLNSRVQ